MATTQMLADMIVCNGIDATNGEYLLPPLDAATIARAALGEKGDRDDLLELKRAHSRVTERRYAAREGVDESSLAESGWGVIFAHGADATVREALAELLDLRREQAGSLYQEITYRPGESKNDFLARYKMGPGPVDPARLPYYLLIVGSPEQIPFRFQYLLDVQFAVGRIHFDSIEEYRNYARSVVRSEKAPACAKKRASFFGVRNAGDRATQLSADSLVKPLAAWAGSNDAGWDVDPYVPGSATKSALGKVLADPPQILFTASHGMGFPNGHARQFSEQGALLCQDWPGPLKRGEISSEMYFSAADVPSGASLEGMVVFMFACFGAGTPRMDEFSRQAFKAPEPIAPRDFVAALPCKLLANPAGGALAVIGHVERAWGYSFAWPNAGPQLTVFESTLERLMNGKPVGRSFEYFNERYAELATDLSSAVENAQFEKVKDEAGLAGLWTAHNDARSYVILGDPAVTIK